MKILFISSGLEPDYQCDMLFHGLRTSFGPEVVDVSRLSYMYASDVASGAVTKSSLYGRGFTLYGLLGGDEKVDRDDISLKIKKRYFDFIIYGSVRRCANYLHDVLAVYDSHRIIFVDGEDDQSIVSHLLGRGIYFKREMVEPIRCGFPIQFAIPMEKLRDDVPSKTRAMALIDPRDRTTYIHETETTYYADYAVSLFGFTQKKAGWDCLRHYEVMANRCIPVFEDLEVCPMWTMVFMPKFEIVEIGRVLRDQGPAVFQSGAGWETWATIESRINSFLKRHCTTTSLALYVIDTARQTEKMTSPMSGAAFLA